VLFQMLRLRSRSVIHGRVLELNCLSLFFPDSNVRTCCPSEEDICLVDRLGILSVSYAQF
jgi:hypothetical protein